MDTQQEGPESEGEVMEPMMVDLDVGDELVEAVIPGEECGEGGTTTGSRENEVNSAIPLSSTEAPRIAKELVRYFAHFGIPGEILTDQGTNFMSDSALLEEVYLLYFRSRGSGRVPTTHRQMDLWSASMEPSKACFASLQAGVTMTGMSTPYLLFAYREVPQEYTGFSPFELLYGWRVRGPLDVLREEWTGEYPTKQSVASHACIGGTRET